MRQNFAIQQHPSIFRLCNFSTRFSVPIEFAGFESFFTFKTTALQNARLHVFRSSQNEQSGDSRGISSGVINHIDSARHGFVEFVQPVPVYFPIRPFLVALIQQYTNQFPGRVVDFQTANTRLGQINPYKNRGLVIPRPIDVS